MQKNKNSVASFTAADNYPIKLFQNHRIIKSIVEDKIVPLAHVQLIPTNKCNLHCSFCSCSADDRDSEMSLEKLTETITVLKLMEVEAVTITGGGEPLLYPSIYSLIDLLHLNGIKIGLVTNGLLLPKQPDEMLQKITWCRISQGDDREDWSDGILKRLESKFTANKSVDWAFSYVVSKTPNYEKIQWLYNFANQNNFTHMRLVADLLEPLQVPMLNLRAQIKSANTPLIFQERTDPEHGHNCRVCYLRPVITPDQKVYACCGAQYAFETPSRNFPESLCLGDVKQLPEIIKNSSEPFPGGEKCTRCYYGNYNRTLDMLFTELNHKEFV